MVLRDRVQLMVESLGWMSFVPVEGEDEYGRNFTYDSKWRPVRVHQ